MIDIVPNASLLKRAHHYLFVLFYQSDSPQIVPKFQLVNIGHTAVITCISNKSISWTFNGDAYFAKNVKFNGENDGTLIIINTKRDNSGTYSCVTKDREDRQYIISSDIVTSGKLNVVL